MIYDEINLAIEFNKGSRPAFTAIYKLLYHSVFLATRSFVPDDEGADITAECFFKLYQRREHFDNMANIRAFLQITARNACINYLKHQKVKVRKEKEILALSDKWETIITRSEIESEVIRSVRTYIESLPSQEARVLSLAYFDGYKNAEIAQILQIKDKTVRNLKTIALNKVKKALNTKNLQNSLVSLSSNSMIIYLIMAAFYQELP
jgi:RNA polymerase sigma factor (sigma-70 family)